jgi:plasmid stabilization system protein ParE
VAQLPVEFHPEAAAELERAYDWYAERSIVAARAFLAEIVVSVDDLAVSHGTWPHYRAKYRRRVLPRFPFSVIYQVTENAVQVVAVAHEKQRPGYWADRQSAG